MAGRRSGTASGSLDAEVGKCLILAPKRYVVDEKNHLGNNGCRSNGGIGLEI
jgi:hypothetical protein